MVFPSGRGATLFLNWKARIADATFFVPESSFSDSQAALAPYSSPHRDIIIPGHMGAARLADLLQHNLPMQERTWLAAYKGSAQGKPWRIQVCAAHGFSKRAHMLLKLHNAHRWGPRFGEPFALRHPERNCNAHAQLQVSELQAQHIGLIGVEGDYAQLMGSARFCLVPRGQSAWTRRAFESFFSGCVPVLLSDHVELPFESSIDYSKMTVKWPGDRIDSSLVRKRVHSTRQATP